MIRKLLSIALAVAAVPVGWAAPVTMSSFTTDGSITGTEYVIGYETAAAGGERKFLLSSLQTYILNGGFSGINATLVAKTTFDGTIATDPVAITPTEGNPDTGVIAIGELLNTLTVDENTTLSLSADTATTGQRFGVRITNSHTANITITLKQSNASTDLTVYMGQYGGNRSTFVMTPSQVVYLVLEDTGSNTYDDLGSAPIQKVKFVGSRASADSTGGAVTVSDTIDGVVIFANTATSYDLEAAANWKGKTVLLHQTSGANIAYINPNGSEVIYLAGAALSGGDRISIAAVAGNYVAVQSDGVSIVVWGYSGTIADAN